MPRWLFHGCGASSSWKMSGMISSVLAVLLQVLAPFSASFEHPHHPQAIVVGGAAGSVTLMYMTVPFNADHLEGLEPGFDWHLGFPMVDTEVPLTVGDVQVPAGKYALNARLGEDEGAWDFVLKTREDEYVLPAKSFEAAHDEHLTMVIHHHGFNTTKRRTADPAGGVVFTLRVSFGDLHREVTITEAFEKQD